MDPLSGTSWILAALIGTSVHAGGTVSMTFESDGRVHGTDGCNRYSSSYALSGDQLRIYAGIVTTRTACVREAMLRATAFLDALENASRFRREGDLLTLLDAKGEELAQFRLGRL